MENVHVKGCTGLYFLLTGLATVLGVRSKLWSGRGWCNALLIFHSRKPRAVDVQLHVYLCLAFQKTVFVICWN